MKKDMKWMTRKVEQMSSSIRANVIRLPMSAKQRKIVDGFLQFEKESNKEVVQGAAKRLIEAGHPDQVALAIVSKLMGVVHRLPDCVVRDSKSLFRDLLFVRDLTSLLWLMEIAPLGADDIELAEAALTSSAELLEVIVEAQEDALKQADNN
jgi:hypothetical protein